MYPSYEGQAQKKKNKSQSETVTYDESLYKALKWRSIGPYRGGRSAAVTGVPGKPNLYYFGSTGGGVWRTTDGGNSWDNISDGYFGGSIGAVAVSEYDHNVIYVGGGEKTVRGNVSFGYGMWKSNDAGETWKQVGLKDSRHIYPGSESTLKTPTWYMRRPWEIYLRQVIPGESTAAKTVVSPGNRCCL